MQWNAGAGQTEGVLFDESGKMRVKLNRIKRNESKCLLCISVCTILLVFVILTQGCSGGSTGSSGDSISNSGGSGGLAGTSFINESFTGNEIWGLPRSELYTTGDDGAVFHFDGTVWKVQYSGTDEPLYFLWGSSESDIYAVGENGTIVHYNGTVWSTMQSGTDNTLRSIWAASSSDLYAVGDVGTILHYDGSSWTSMTSGIEDDIVNIIGFSSTDIFAVGENGTVLHYNGTTWSRMETGTDEFLNDISGVSASSLFVAGDNGIVLHYDGTQWKPIGSGVEENLNCLWALSEGEALIGGDDGALLYCSGEQITSMRSPVDEHVNGMWGASGNDVSAVCDNGTVLHYDGTDWALTALGGDPNSELSSDSSDSDTDDAVWQEDDEEATDAQSFDSEVFTPGDGGGKEGVTSGYGGGSESVPVADNDEGPAAGNSISSKLQHSFVILHTNDLHGYVMQHHDGTGGMANLAAVIKNEKGKYKGRVLLLDAGDIAQTHGGHDHLSDRNKGKPVIDIMKNIGYDAVTIGNHEFFWGLGTLKDMIDRVSSGQRKFRVLCSNVYHKNGTSLYNLKATHVFKVNGVKVGVIGITTQKTKKQIKPHGALNDYNFRSPNKSAIHYLNSLKHKADLIVVLSHLGKSSDEFMAKKVKGVGIIVGGHSHHVINQPEKIKDTYIVQTGCYCHNVGKLEVTFDSSTKKITRCTGSLIRVPQSGIAPDPDALEIISSYKNMQK